MPSHKCLIFGWRGAQIETIYLGDRKLSVRTSVLEEKATACNMLCCYADELKEGFYPFVEQVHNRLHFLSAFNFPYVSCLFSTSQVQLMLASNYPARGRCQTCSCAPLLSALPCGWPAKKTSAARAGEQAPAQGRGVSH